MTQKRPAQINPECYSKRSVMNPFVDLKNRSFTLPNGCKDLIDVLQQRTQPIAFKTLAAGNSFIIETRLPSSHCAALQIEVRGNAICVTGRQSPPFEFMVEVPAGHNLNLARAVFENGVLRITVPKV